MFRRSLAQRALAFQSVAAAATPAEWDGALKTFADRITIRELPSTDAAAEIVVKCVKAGRTDDAAAVASFMHPGTGKVVRRAMESLRRPDAKCDAATNVATGQHCLNFIERFESEFPNKDFQAAALIVAARVKSQSLTTKCLLASRRAGAEGCSTAAGDELARAAIETGQWREAMAHFGRALGGDGSSSSIVGNSVATSNSNNSTSGEYVDSSHLGPLLLAAAPHQPALVLRLWSSWVRNTRAAATAEGQSAFVLALAAEGRRREATEAEEAMARNDLPLHESAKAALLDMHFNAKQLASSELEEVSFSSGSSSSGAAVPMAPRRRRVDWWAALRLVRKWEAASAPPAAATDDASKKKAKQAAPEEEGAGADGEEAKAAGEGGAASEEASTSSATGATEDAAAASSAVGGGMSADARLQIQIKLLQILNRAGKKDLAFALVRQIATGSDALSTASPPLIAAVTSEETLGPLLRATIPLATTDGDAAAIVLSAARAVPNRSPEMLGRSAALAAVLRNRAELLDVAAALQAQGPSAEEFEDCLLGLLRPLGGHEWLLGKVAVADMSRVVGLPVSDRVAAQLLMLHQQVESDKTAVLEAHLGGDDEAAAEKAAAAN